VRTTPPPKIIIKQKLKSFEKAGKMEITLLVEKQQLEEHNYFVNM
jgi:hypothetical protein